MLLAFSMVYLPILAQHNSEIKEVGLCVALRCYPSHFRAASIASCGELASHFHSSSGCERLAASFRASLPEGFASFG